MPIQLNNKTLYLNSSDAKKVKRRSEAPGNIAGNRRLIEKHGLGE